ncbi:MAG: pilin [Candidatus Paceibacterota bacterium]
MKKFLIHLLITSVLLLPVLFTNSVVYANGSTPPPSGQTQGSGSGYTGVVPSCEGDTCNFSDIIVTIKSLVNFATGIALMFSVVVIAYAGYNYMTSGDNAGKRAEANKMLWKVVVGIILVMAAWLIVNLIVSVLVDENLRESESFPI